MLHENYCFLQFVRRCAQILMMESNQTALANKHCPSYKKNNMTAIINIAGSQKNILQLDEGEKQPQKKPSKFTKNASIIYR